MKRKTSDLCHEAAATEEGNPRAMKRKLSELLLWYVQLPHGDLSQEINVQISVINDHLHSHALSPPPAVEGDVAQILQPTPADVQISVIKDHLHSHAQSPPPAVDGDVAQICLPTPADPSSVKKTITRDEVRSRTPRTWNIDRVANTIAKFSGSRLVKVDISAGDFGCGYVHQLSMSAKSAKFLVTTGDKNHVLALVSAVADSKLPIDTAAALAQIYQNLGFAVRLLLGQDGMSIIENMRMWSYAQAVGDKTPATILDYLVRGKVLTALQTPPTKWTYHVYTWLTRVPRYLCTLLATHLLISIGVNFLRSHCSRVLVHTLTG
jgi:hypothetical protein